MCYYYRTQNFGVAVYAYQHIRLLGYLGVGLCKFAGISISDRLIYTYIVTLQQAYSPNKWFRDYTKYVTWLRKLKLLIL